MNPEEGELRPQLLDRFGLSVALANPADAAQRTAILRARLGFDENPEALGEQHAGEQRALSAALVAARAALPHLAGPTRCCTMRRPARSRPVWTACAPTW
jgi:magnesium chelatase subunit I